MKQIDFYYDFRSPFAYFAFQRLSIFRDLGATINYKPVSVSALINLQVNRDPLAEVLDPMSPAKRKHFMSDIFRLIEHWSIPFAPPEPTPPVCTKAMIIAAQLAESGDDQSDWVERIFTGVWIEQEDAESDKFLEDSLKKTNFGTPFVGEPLDAGLNMLIGNTKAAYELGVFGTPTFICEHQLYFGADRMELLASKL